MALLCLGYDPTITNSVWLVKVAIRSRRQSIWVTYTSRRYTAFYTGFCCMLQLYMDLASSRLACRDIQRIQRIQRIQLYSYTRYTAYSTIQPPSASARWAEGAVPCSAAGGDVMGSGLSYHSPAATLCVLPPAPSSFRSEEGGPRAGYKTKLANLKLTNCNPNLQV